MYDGHGDGNPEPVRQALPHEAPLGIKVLLGFALLSLCLSIATGLERPFELVALGMDVLRVGLLLALLGMRSWAWTAYLWFQGGVLALFGLAVLGGSSVSILKVGFATIVIAYLFSIRDRYRDRSREDPD